MSINSISPQTLPVKHHEQCQCQCQCGCHKTCQPNKTDVVEIKGKEKNFFVKAKDFAINNKSTIKAAGVGVAKGLLTACTILGASQIIDKVTKATSKNLANTLALISAVGITAADVIKAKKAQKNGKQ